MLAKYISSSLTPLRDPYVLAAAFCVTIILIFLWVITSGNRSLGVSIAITSTFPPSLPLRQVLHEATARARLYSALATRPLSHHPLFVRQGGLDFSISHADLSTKEKTVNIDKQGSEAAKDDPLDAGAARGGALYVAGITVGMKGNRVASLSISDAASYTPPAASTNPPATKGFSLLLNKFNTLPDHALIVTDLFERQSAPLDRFDLAAWYFALSQTAAVGLFNSDFTAGASQRHKHMQIIPLDAFWSQRPLDAIYPLPVDHLILPSIVSGANAAPECGTLKVAKYPTFRLAAFAFKHSVAVIQVRTL